MESESGQSDITTIDPTKRIVKYFSKCLIELIKHAESIQYKNNKLINYDVTSTVKYDSGNEIDITEHNFKTEIKKEGPVFKQIEKIQQCIVELLTICSQQSISIDYDTTKSHVTIYDGFDDPQRVLVMNHLTLHILSIVENIYLSIKFFKFKNVDNGQYIKKTFSQIYKEIKSLPMRPDIIDNMDSSFKSLTHKSEYKDSYNYLVEKLNVLPKYICKFNKAYLKNCVYNDFLTEESTDDDNSSRKKIKNRTLQKTYIKPENINVEKEPESVFKIPESMENINPNMDTSITHSNETTKKKKRKINSDTEKQINDNCEEPVITITESSENINQNMDTTNTYSDETAKKRNEKINTDTENEIDDNSEEQESVFTIPESMENIDTANTRSEKSPKKKKRKINTDTEKEISDNCEEQESVITFPESMENINPNIDTANTHSDKSPKKKNRKINTDSEKEISGNCEEQESVTEFMENINSNLDTSNKDSDETQKRKINKDTENEMNDNCETERDLLLNELLADTIKNVNTISDTEKRHKKKKKSKDKPEHNTKDISCNTLHKQLDELINDCANKSNQKQNNTEGNNMENSLNECENDKSNKKNKRKNENIENSGNSTHKDEITKKIKNQKKIAKEILQNQKKRKIEDESTKKPTKKRKLKKLLSNTETLNNAEENKHNRDEMNEEELSFLEKHFLSTENIESNQSIDAENDDNSTDNDTIPEDVLTAISSGDIEIDYENNELADYTKIIKQNNLNEHERFLYIQDLVEAAHSKLAVTEEKKEKIRKLNILVDWEVCPVHLACSNISAGPNEEERILFEQHGVTSGQFSKKEDEIIRKNWEIFYKKHDLEDDPSPFMVMVVDSSKLLTYTERRKFLQHIGRGLPHRSLHSIFRRFKNLFKPKVKYGRFSPEEDELILTYLSKIKREDNRQKYVRLAPLINRDRWQIERRFRALKEATKPESSTKIQWTLKLKETFLKHLLEETQSESVEDLRDKHIDHDMYILIGKLMNISPIKLKLHWTFRLHSELFASEPINLDTIKIKMIKKFKELEYDDWKTIDWEPIKAMFDGITKSYLWISLKNVIRDSTPVELHNNLKAAINYLCDEFVPILEAKKKDKNKILPRLRYENGTLIQFK